VTLLVVPDGFPGDVPEHEGHPSLPWSRFVDSLCAQVLPAQAAATPMERFVALALDEPSPELALALDHALSVTAQAGIGADLLGAVAKPSRDGGALQMFELGPQARAQAHALASAQKRLDARLRKAGLADPAALLSLLGAALAGADASSITAALGARDIKLFCHPADVASQAALCRALDDCLRRVNGSATLLLPHVMGTLDADRERSPFEIIADEAARLLDAAPELLPCQSPLSDALFSPQQPFVPAPEGTGARISIVRVFDSDAQGRAVSAAVARELARGTPPELVAIAIPRMDPETTRPLRRALRAAQVPFAMQDELLESAPSITFLDALLGQIERFERMGAASLLQSQNIRARTLLPGTQENLTRGALRVLSSRLRDQRLGRNETFVGAIGRVAAPGTGRDAGFPVAEAAAALVAAIAPMQGAKTFAEALRGVAALVRGLGVDAAATVGAFSFFAADAAASSLAAQEATALAFDARAMDAMAQVLRELGAALQRYRSLGAPCEAGRLRGILRICLGRPGLLSGARVGAVRVVSARGMMLTPVSVLYVMDAAAERLTPGRPVSAVLSDVLLAELRGRSRGAPLPDSVVARAAQGAALSLACARAAHIVLVAPERDAAGAELGGSPATMWLKLGGVPLQVPEPEALPEAHHRLDVQRRARMETLREGFFLDPSRPRSAEIGELSLADAARRALGEATGGSSQALAVTSLEHMAVCAFRGLAHEVFRARDTGEMGETLDAREEGKLLHEALRVAFEASGDLWQQRERPAAELLQRAGVALDKLFGTPSSAIEAAEQARVRTSCLAFVERGIADLEWDFHQAEWSFGEGTAGPMVIESEGHRLLLRGRIDRVDRSHLRASVRVIDYKRSKSQVLAAAKELGETMLQVPLYACHARRTLGVPAVMGRYWPTSERHAVLMDRTHEAFDKRMDDLLTLEPRTGLSTIEAIALNTVRRLRDGHVAPLPTDEGACRTCSVAGGCRRPRFSMRADEDES
jgi:RecB family exonuclease